MRHLASKNHVIRYALLALIACSMQAGAADQRSMDVDTSFTKFTQEIDEMRPNLSAYDKYPKFVAERYEKYFGWADDGENIGTLSSKELRLLFRAANIAAFYTLEGDYRKIMEKCFYVLKSRGMNSELEYGQLYGALVSSRLFKRADVFYKKYSSHGLDKLPEYEDMSGAKESPRTVLTFRANRREWYRRNAVLKNGAFVVVVGHALCHFTQHAVQDIEEHPKLVELFNSNSIWVAPQDRHVYVHEFQEWNKRHPEAELNVAYKESEWPEIDYWGTPTFYFFKDGKLVKKVVGWPDNGNLSALRAGFHAIGL